LDAFGIEWGRILAESPVDANRNRRASPFLLTAHPTVATIPRLTRIRSHPLLGLAGFSFPLWFNLVVGHVSTGWVSRRFSGSR